MVAIVGSFATAAYGVSIAHMRTHYAHSISVMVVLETFQSIFFSGALSLNFPSVLVAWWSNFAWSAAQIFSRSMIKSMNSFNGVSGNDGQVGNAGSVVGNKNEGDLAQQIYGRSHHLNTATMDHLLRRQPFNESNPYDYTWAGHVSNPGLPLPGTWTGFRGTLAAIGIPAADAFTISLVWFSVLLGILVLSLTFLKLSLECLVRIKRMGEDRLLHFRSNWLHYTIIASLRVLFMAFSVMMTLIFYQFSSGGSAGAKALATVFFLLFLLGTGGLATYACHLRLRSGQYVVRQDRVLLMRDSWLRVVPLICFVRLSTLKEAELPGRQIGSIPFIRVLYHNDDLDRATVHEDHDYVKRFGWLSARYRRTRWWFFGCNLLYHLVRAVFIGGAVASPEAQVYGLLTFEIIAFLVFAKLRPFEGRRNMALAVWMLGTSKILTTGLSIAFLPTMRANRILATAIGMVIIILQGLLIIGLIILVTLGAISSYMSLTRNKDGISPEALESTRVQYFEHLQTTAGDVHLSKEQREWQNKLQEAEKDIPPIQPSFSVISVRRVSKIEDEDEDEDTFGALEVTLGEAPASDPNRLSRPKRLSRTNSVSSRMSTHSLPRAARPYRTSWSSRDFGEWDALSLKRADSIKRTSGYGLPPSNSSNVVPPYVVEEEPALRGSVAAHVNSEHRPTTPTTPLESLPDSTTDLQMTTGDSSAGKNSDMKILRSGT
ncbi:hypothetical protein SLS64_004048 [Diaporthe eres]|uniref:TRP C-terminal domain-containing protein n=1 Tax=Diaporthe eres TaxID=83184 RepID=A0ABR1PQJ8_DIAER